MREVVSVRRIADQLARAGSLLPDMKEAVADNVK